MVRSDLEFIAQQQIEHDPVHIFHRHPESERNEPIFFKAESVV